MCGRYTSTSTLDQLASMYEVDDVRSDPLPVRYNVAPTQEVYAVAVRAPREVGERPRRQLGQFKWGLVPSWAKAPSMGNKMINARSEGLATKQAYRAALARRRCLIPADAFYEWQERGSGKGKLPFAIRLANGESMAFGGLWEVWRPRDDPSAELLRSCVIVTTAANDRLAVIHDRMPLVLPQSAWQGWLDPEGEAAQVQELMVPAPSEWFETFAVSTLVNKVANEGPDLLTPLPPPPGAPRTD